MIISRVRNKACLGSCSLAMRISSLRLISHYELIKLIFGCCRCIFIQMMISAWVFAVILRVLTLKEIRLGLKISLYLVDDDIPKVLDEVFFAKRYKWPWLILKIKLLIVFLIAANYLIELSVVLNLLILHQRYRQLEILIQLGLIDFYRVLIGKDLINLFPAQLINRLDKMSNNSDDLQYLLLKEYLVSLMQSVKPWLLGILRLNQTSLLLLFEFRKQQSVVLPILEVVHTLNVLNSLLWVDYRERL